MTIGASIFLIAVGAILAFAVNISTSAFEIDTVGVILMIAGGIGLLISLFLWASAANGRRSTKTVRPDGTARETTTREY